MEKPIFVIGLHRTGSTLLKNIIDASDEVAMAEDEMHISSPWRIDVVDYYNRYKVNDKRSAKQFVDFLTCSKPYGSFWDHLEDVNIDKDNILNEMNTDYSLFNIIKNLMKEYAKQRYKKRFGAKYPVHFSKIDLLLDWFPNCKVIHLTRDPRAICASKVNDESTIKRKEKWKILSPFIHWFTIMFFILEYNWSSSIHEKYKDEKNYYLVKYEDLIRHPEQAIKSLASFCEIEYKDSLLVSRGKESSLVEEENRGFDVRRIEKWKDVLNPIEKVIIDIFTRSSQNTLMKAEKGDF